MRAASPPPGVDGHFQARAAGLLHCEGDILLAVEVIDRARVVARGHLDGGRAVIDVLAYGLPNLVVRVSVNELVSPETLVARTHAEDRSAIGREDLARVDDVRPLHPSPSDRVDDVSRRVDTVITNLLDGRETTSQQDFCIPRPPKRPQGIALGHVHSVEVSLTVGQVRGQMYVRIDQTWKHPRIGQIDLLLDAFRSDLSSYLDDLPVADEDLLVVQNSLAGRVDEMACVNHDRLRLNAKRCDEQQEGQRRW